MGGEIAVANFDEDSLTMSVEAISDSLKGLEAAEVGGIFLASTTFPYQEKQSASIAAVATDLRQDIVTSDYSGSARCGSIALKSAIDSVKAGSAESIIVAASDSRMGDPGTEFIQLFGDGAAAFVVSNREPVVSIEESFCRTNEFTDFWRTKDNKFVRSNDPAFMREHGYFKDMTIAVEGLMNKCGVEKKALSKVVYNAYDQRTHQEMARRLGFDWEEQVQDSFFQTIGHTGCASALMGLGAVLQESTKDDLILFANYGDGCDAYLLKIQAGIDDVNRRVYGVKGWLREKKEMKFHQYLRFRNIIEKEM